MRLHCVFSCLGGVGVKEEKIAGHQAKFQDQLSDLRPQIVHGSQLKWDASIHPDLFVGGDPATAWQAVERLFSTVHYQVGSKDAMSQEKPGNELQPEEDKLAMSQEIPGNEPQPEEDELSEQSETDSSDDHVPMLESDEEEDINGRWIDERFGPDSSGCISMPTLF